MEKGLLGGSDNWHRYDRTAKVRRINAAISLMDNPKTMCVGLQQLRGLCISPNGLVSDTLRARSWPLLIAAPIVEVMNAADQTCSTNTKRCHRRRKSKRKKSSNPCEDIAESNGTTALAHPDLNQVDLDVMRSLRPLLIARGVMRDHQLFTARLALSKVIAGVLVRHPILCYYQGFHDVCSVVLLVCGVSRVSQARVICEAMSLRLLRDFMEPSLDGTLYVLSFLSPLLQLIDPPLYDHLVRADHANMHFALPWIITLFTHDCFEPTVLPRLFDVWLASHPLFPIYVAATIIIMRRSEILSLPPDFATIHGLLAKFPSHIDAEYAIAYSYKIFKKYPPKVIIPIKPIRPSSVIVHGGNGLVTNDHGFRGMLTRYSVYALSVVVSTVAAVVVTEALNGLNFDVWN